MPAYDFWFSPSFGISGSLMMLVVLFVDCPQRVNKNRHEIRRKFSGEIQLTGGRRLWRVKVGLVLVDFHGKARPS
jgi:hypothetical protein